MRSSERQKREPARPRRYYHFYKPVGCVSACRDPEHATVLDYFPPEERPGLFPVGRLDRNAQGLMIVTDDGKLNHRLLSPENHIEKTYRLWAAGTPEGDWLERLASGVALKGLPEPTKPAGVSLLEQAALGALPVTVFENRRELARQHPELPAYCLSLTITEGKRHQIKRMLEAVGCTVVWLKRISIAGVVLDSALRPGEYRPMTAAELERLGTG